MRTFMKRPGRLALPAMALGATLVIGVSAGQAADPVVAGDRSTQPVAAPTDHLARAEARGRSLDAALGIPSVSHRARRLDDAFEHRTYDEVSSFDAAGREVAISRFELDGSVAMAVALGWKPGAGRTVDGPGATARGRAFALAAGLAPGGPPDVRRSAASGGWSITWQRLVDGVPVRGDGTRISLWPDGSFHGLTRTDRPLAAAPSRSMTPAAARVAAGGLVAGRLGAAASDLRLVGVERAWVARNDAFDPVRADARAETLRLAWIARYDSHGALVDRLRSVELWIDAGDGSLLGGDLVE